MERIVFISLFLGLVSGTQWVEMRADSEIKAIRITLGGDEAILLPHPPWHSAVDFGGLQPKELVATGLGSRGEVVATERQFLNLPRPVAELVAVAQEKNGIPTAVTLVWHHRENARPKKATIMLDGAPLEVAKDFSARLPAMGLERSHLVSAEMRFAGGSVARCDLVLHGGFSDESGTQLTPIVLNASGAQTSEGLSRCITLNGEPVRSVVAESEDAVVTIVKDPNPAEARKVLRPTAALFRHGKVPVPRIEFDADTSFRILWPVTTPIGRQLGEPSTKLFRQTNDLHANRDGVSSLLLQRFERNARSLQRQYADGVAVAGLRAVGTGRRRAVVLLLSKNADTSYYKPAEVRRYLSAIGVPLFVWSLTGPRPDLADSWGPVHDISTDQQLRSATDEVRAALRKQQIAWVALDPLRALRVQAREGCGVMPLASSQER